MPRGRRCDRGVVQHRARTIRVPQLQNRCLRPRRRAAAAGRMIGVAFDLYRPSELARDQYAAGESAVHESRCVIRRGDRRLPLGHLHIGQDLFGWRAAACALGDGGCRGQPAQKFAAPQVIERRQVVVVAHARRRHGRDLFGRSQMFLRRAMTIETPLHVERRYAPIQRHLIDAPVTLDAGDAFVDVNAVIEIHEVRQIMQALPRDGFARAQALVQRRKHGRIGEQLRMAGEADLRRRHAGAAFRFHSDVAVATIDAVIEHMMFVAERQGLVRGGSDRVRVLRAPPEQYDRRHDHDRQRQQSQFDEQHAAQGEDLRHPRLSSTVLVGAGEQVWCRA
ncbi:conserved hypothetical protein, partial [Ricinus communis]